MWTPRTESDLQLAIDEGSLTENRHLDVKRETGNTNSARAETAKDLASFALDGGALLIGIAEDKTSGAFILTPQPLAGLPEKIEQIAMNRVDPPLFVRLTTIPSVEDPSLGYVHVEVPPSASAPHMVDGRYYARGDRTTRRLTDAEIVRVHKLRDDRETEVAQVLHEEITRDPFPETERKQGHLYLIAEPLLARRDLLVDFLRKREFGEILSLLRSAEHTLDGSIRDFAPGPSSLTYFPTRARGLAATSFTDGVRGGDKERERYAYDVELQEHGGIRLFCGRLTDDWGRDESYRVILDGLAVANTLRVIRWAQAIAAETGYRGAWGFGLASNKMLGLQSSFSVSDWRGSGHPYDRDSYEATTVATLEEIETSPGAVANRLLGQLVRGLGTEKVHQEWLS